MATAEEARIRRVEEDVTDVRRELGVLAKELAALTRVVDRHGNSSVQLSTKVAEVAEQIEGVVDAHRELIQQRTKQEADEAAQRAAILQQQLDNQKKIHEEELAAIRRESEARITAAKDARLWQRIKKNPTATIGIIIGLSTIIGLIITVFKWLIAHIDWN